MREWINSVTKMEISTITWIILGFISVVMLIYSFAVGMSIIWKVCIIGFLIGLGIAVKLNYDGMGFDWIILLKGVILGTTFGIIISFFKKHY